MDRLPAEIITQIAFDVPFSMDALALAHTNRNTYHALSAKNRLFWYKRRLQFPTTPMPGQSMEGASPRGSIFTEMIEDFDPEKDYRQLVVLALRREPETVVNPILRCQACCIQRAYKVWEEFNKALCRDCFEVDAIDRPTIRFLLKDPKVDLTKVRVQQKSRGMNIRNCFWVQDLEREIAKAYPGKTLKILLEEDKVNQKSKVQDKIQYRDDHEERLIDAATERWEEDALHLEMYRHFFDNILYPFNK